MTLHEPTTLRPGHADAPREIEAVAISQRVRPQSYEDLYGTARQGRRAAIDEVSSKSHTPARGAQFGTLGFTLAGIAMVMALVAGRSHGVKAAPLIARAYAAIGLPVNVRGLDIRHVKAMLFDDGGRKTLGVEGEIVNLTPTTQAIPELSFGLRNEGGREVYTWTSTAQVSRIEKDGTILFRARLASPPEDVQDVLVHFVKLEPKPTAAPGIGFRGAQSP